MEVLKVQNHRRGKRRFIFHSSRSAKRQHADIAESEGCVTGGSTPGIFWVLRAFLAICQGFTPVRQRQALLTPKKYPPPQKTSKPTVPTHQTSATPQPSGGCHTLNFWGVDTVFFWRPFGACGAVWPNKVRRAFFIWRSFFHTLCAGTHI